ncbi:brf RNA polymerase III subunit [Brevipalpus obovatus]|uniref:brf RNA polymerase III subunit n=1 Tax=Brevipalpus obovatus TaxID=246614 RepID=UPI003D9DF343
MNSRRSCKCGSSDLETDAARGDTVCTACGSVIEDGLIVSEVQYQEGTRGGSNMVGQNVTGDSGPYMMGMSGFGNGKASKTITLDRAKRRIREVGTSLNLNNYNIEVAFNFYKMALNKRLTCGRKNNHVIAACIYIACRLKQTDIMLLDLSDRVQVNVYELGRTYLKLASALCMNLPMADPSIYIQRFAHRLNLGDRSNEIINTANRLVARMNRDWMHYGRRPSGLCGAALLVALRLHEIDKSVKEMVDIVKVCETTIRKRLNEFGDTPSGKLTKEEFMEIELEGSEDPPCYKNANKKLKSILESKERLEEVEDEVAKIQRQIEEKLESIRKKFRSPYVKAKDLEIDKDISLGSDDSEIEEMAEKFVQEDQFHVIKEIVGQEDPTADSFLKQLDALQPTAASLGIRSSLDFGFSRRGKDKASDGSDGESSRDPDDLSEQPERCEESGELDLDGIDDAELDMYILSQQEVKVKTKLWHKVNSDYLKEMEEKEKRKLEEEAERKRKENAGEIIPKRRRRTRVKTHIEANTAGEAIERMLEEKKLSNKINYDVLRRL